MLVLACPRASQASNAGGQEKSKAGLAARNSWQRNGKPRRTTAVATIQAPTYRHRTGNLNLWKHLHEGKCREKKQLARCLIHCLLFPQTGVSARYRMSTATMSIMRESNSKSNTHRSCSGSSVGGVGWSRPRLRRLVALPERVAERGCGG